MGREARSLGALLVGLWARPLAALVAVLGVCLALAACAGAPDLDGPPDAVPHEEVIALETAREGLDDAIDTEETLRTSKQQARRLRRGVQGIVSGGALEAEKLDEFGLAALGQLRRLVPSLVEVNRDGSVRALDRPATSSFLRYAESDAPRALVRSAREHVEAIERTLKDSEAGPDTRIPPADPTASQDLTVADYLRQAERDLRPIWPELAGRLQAVRKEL